LQIANRAPNLSSTRDFCELLEASLFAFENGWNHQVAIQEFAQVWLYLQNTLPSATYTTQEVLELATLTQKKQ
jgi:hypothetical protein